MESTNMPILTAVTQFAARHIPFLEEAKGLQKAILLRSIIVACGKNVVSASAIGVSTNGKRSDFMCVAGA